MFHLVIPNRDLIAHAVSFDGLSWEAVAPALRTGNPGDWDDDMIRTVSVTRANGRYVMLYGATCRREGGREERIMTAVSDDLMIWEKTPGFIPADPRFYEQLHQNPDHVSWRDPKIYYEDGVYFCLICARINHGPYLRRGCVGLMKSTDLVEWEVCPPLFAPYAFYDLECPQLYKIGGLYYLIACVIEDQTQRYWVSKSISGPFEPAGNPLLMPAWSHYAGRLARFQGRDVFACWTFALEDGPSPFGLQIAKGHVIKYVPAVLDVRQDNNGSLYLCSPAAWENYAGQTVPWDKAEHSLCMHNPTAFMTDHTLTVLEGMEACCAQFPDIHDFTLKAQLSVAAHSGGVCFHLDEDAAGYFLEFCPTRGTVRLIKHAHCTLESGQPWFDYRVLQECAADFSMGSISILLRHIGGEIEISLNGRVCFSTVTTALHTGCIGIYAQNGSVNVQNMSIISMRIPENR